MRTLATLIDISIPEKMAMDSYDFARVFLDEKVEIPIRDHLVHHSGNGVFAIRMHDWKLILGRDSGGFTKYTPPADAPAGQLYNLDKDPEEKENLYDQYPEVVEELAKTLNMIKQGED